MYFNTNISLIKVPRKFSVSHPNEDKMNACRAYYRENHKLDRDIVVDENMQLKDGYIGYLILKENNVSVVGVKQAESGRTTLVGVKQAESGRTTLVYGVHPGVEKEYCWKVVTDTEDTLNLKVGSHAIVRTRFGDAEILVTRLERVSKAKKKKMGHVKRVVRCLPE